jgi:hypothetical protein
MHFTCMNHHLEKELHQPFLYVCVWGALNLRPDVVEINFH